MVSNCLGIPFHLWVEDVGDRKKRVHSLFFRSFINISSIRSQYQSDLVILDHYSNISWRKGGGCEIVIPRTYWAQCRLSLKSHVWDKFFLRDLFGFLLFLLSLFLWSHLQSEIMDIHVAYHLCQIKDRSICILEWDFPVYGVKEVRLCHRPTIFFNVPLNI